VRRVGVDELLQFDWTLVGESDAVADAAAQCGALDQLDVAAIEGRLRRLRETIADRRRYLEIQA